jgi:hypothetical protein
MKTISLKRNCKPMNEMKGSLADEFNNLGIEKHEIICDSGNEIKSQRC